MTLAAESSMQCQGPTNRTRLGYVFVVCQCCRSCMCRSAQRKEHSFHACLCDLRYQLFLESSPYQSETAEPWKGDHLHRATRQLLCRHQTRPSCGS